MDRCYRWQEEGKEGAPGRGPSVRRPWGGKEHGRLTRPGWLGRGTRRRRAVPWGLICSAWPPRSSGHPRRHQPLHRVFRRRPAGGAVSPGGEGPPGPSRHPLRLVPGPGLDQFHHGAAHWGRLPGGSPRAQPETAAGAGHLNPEAWSWREAGWPGALWTHLGRLRPLIPPRPLVEARGPTRQPLWTKLWAWLLSQCLCCLVECAVCPRVCVCSGWRRPRGCRTREMTKQPLNRRQNITERSLHVPALASFHLHPCPLEQLFVKEMGDQRG